LKIVAPWIRKQKKIARRTYRKWQRGYFTCKMLERDIVIRGGITGLDPDKEDRGAKNRSGLIGIQGSGSVLKKRRNVAASLERNTYQG